MQILIIDNTIDPDSWGSSELCTMARLAAPGATIRVRRAPHDDLPAGPQPFDRIIVSGSKTLVDEEAPWISKLDEFIRRTVDAGKPYLGVCYGHQALSRALGGKKHVRRAPRGEFGWVEIENQAPESRLLRGLPRAFHTFEWHNDEVCELPRGMRALARSELCPIQACELEGKPVFGVQFHPERDLEGGERSLARRRKENPKLEILNVGKGARLFDAAVGQKIFGNFLALERDTTVGQ